MKKRKLLENIVIGCIDGLTVPFALGAGLIAARLSAHTIFLCCLIVTFLFSLMMAISAHISVKKYEPSQQPVTAAFVIGSSYFLGGLLVSIPYFITRIPFTAFTISTTITVVLLLIAGYVDSKVHGANAPLGALRAACTAVLAAAAAYWIAGLFS